jgi:hypothetical protein
MFRDSLFLPRGAGYNEYRLETFDLPALSRPDAPQKILCEPDPTTRLRRRWKCMLKAGLLNHAKRCGSARANG